MKRTIIFILLILPSYQLWAGNRYGISLGVNLGGIKTDWAYQEDPDIYPRFGYSLGLGSETNLKNNLSLLLNLNLVSKNYGFSPEYYGEGTEGFDRYSLIYIDLPARICYNYKNMRLFAGPFIDYCLSGKNRYNFILPDSSVAEGNLSIKSGKEFSHGEIRSERLAVNYLDGGVIFGIGYQDPNYAIDLSYSLGLINTYPSVDANDRINNKTRTRMLMLNLFFYF